MTANKKQRDTQIPVEAIEGAAGKDDKGITIVAINPVVLGLLNEKMSNKKKTLYQFLRLLPVGTDRGARKIKPNWMGLQHKLTSIL